MPSIVTMTGPGNAVVADDAAAAIAIQTTAITAGMNSIILQIGNPEVPGTLLACLSGINDSLARIADTDTAISKSISDLNTAIGTLSISQSALNAIQSTAAANQIQTNNFQMQATKEALERAGLPPPTMPPLAEQWKTAIAGGLALDAAATAQGVVSSIIKSNLASLSVWTSQTAAYQTVAGWLTSVKASILSALPPSPQSALTKIKGGSV